MNLKQRIKFLETSSRVFNLLTICGLLTTIIFYEKPKIPLYSSVGAFICIIGGIKTGHWLNYYKCQLR